MGHLPPALAFGSTIAELRNFCAVLEELRDGIVVESSLYVCSQKPNLNPLGQRIKYRKG